MLYSTCAFLPKRVFDLAGTFAFLAIVLAVVALSASILTIDLVVTRSVRAVARDRSYIISRRAS